MKKLFMTSILALTALTACGVESNYSELTKSRFITWEDYEQDVKEETATAGVNHCNYVIEEIMSYKYEIFTKPSVYYKNNVHFTVTYSKRDIETTNGFNVVMYPAITCVYEFKGSDYFLKSLLVNGEEKNI